MVGTGHPLVGPEALRALRRSPGLPSTLTEAGYQPRPIETMASEMVASPFNRASPYKPTQADYAAITAALMG